MKPKVSTVQYIQDKTSKENLTPNIYNKKTPKINSQVKNSDKQSLDSEDENLYRRRTRKLNDSNTKEEKLTPRSACIFNKNKLTPEDSELTPRSIHIFSKNVSRKAIIEKPADTSDSNLTDMSVSKVREKSSSMSSLRLSENSSKNINRAKDSFNSTKSRGSFSPIKSNVINNILEDLQDSLNSTAGSSNKNKKSSESNYKFCDSLDDLNLETPKNKNVTLRKKWVKRVTRDEAANVLEEEDMFPTSNSEDKAVGAEQKKTINEDVENAAGTVGREKISGSSLNLSEKNVVGRNRRSAVKKLFVELKTDEISKKQRRHTVGPSKNEEENNYNTRKTSLRKAVENSPAKKLKLTLSKEKNEDLNNSSSIRTRRQTMSCSILNSDSTKQLKRSSSSIDLGENEDSSGKKKYRKLYTPTDFKELAVSDEKEREEKRKCKKKKSDSGVFIKLTIFTQKEKAIVTNPTENLERTTRKSNKKKSEKQYNSDEDEQVELKKEILYKKNKICDKTPKKTTNPTENLVTTRKSSKKSEKQYNSDEDEQVELKKEILNKKNKICDKTPKKTTNPTENLELTTRKSSKKSEKQYNSDEDEQVELKKEILNKKNKIYDKTQKKTTPATSKLSTRTPKVSNTPRQSKTILSIKSTSNNKSQRRSTLEFQSLNQSAKKRLKIDAVKKPSIVCTKMHRSEVQMFTQIVKKIGGFDVENEVSRKTTHLVAGEPKRTINMLRALAMGCWILKKEWLYRSLESGKWLPEEDFEETDFSTAVQKNRLQRQAFGPSFSSDIFQDYGPMYIAKSSIPRCSDLRELIQMCKGRITTTPRIASIVVGQSVKYEGVTCVKETWILDCITHNKKYPFKKYLF